MTIEFQVLSVRPGVIMSGEVNGGAKGQEGGVVVGGSYEGGVLPREGG